MNKVISAVKKAIGLAQKHHLLLDSICAVALVLMPILQHYKGLIDNAGTTVLAIFVPYLALRILPRLRQLQYRQVSLAVVLAAFFVYKVIDHGTSLFEIAQACLVIGYLLAVSLDCVNVKLVTAAASCVAAVAGLILLLQTFCYYVLDFHLQLVPTGLLLAESEPWVLGVQTGLVDINGKVGNLYRPAAFFLEPSHVFMYAFPLLFINLFERKNVWIHRSLAVLISIAMVLCTSGMGIVVAAGAWGLFIILWNEKDGSLHARNILRKRNLILVGAMAAMAVLAVLCVPVVRQSVVRIFSKAEGSSAISGRTERAISLLKKMNVKQWLIGTADTIDGIKYNMPGFMATAYKYGIIGIVLSYWLYVRGLFELNVGYFWFTVILLVVSFFSAHTHGTFYMLYYVFLLMRGHRVSKEAWIKEFPELFRGIGKKATTDSDPYKE